MARAPPHFWSYAMKKLTFAIIFLLSVHCFASFQQVQFVDEFDKPISMSQNTVIYIYKAGTNQLLNIYLDSSRTRRCSQPITATSTNTPFDYSKGQLKFYSPYASYKIDVNDGSLHRVIDGLNSKDRRIKWPSYMREIGRQIADINDITPWGSNWISHANDTEALNDLGIERS